MGLHAAGAISSGLEGISLEFMREKDAGRSKASGLKRSPIAVWERVPARERIVVLSRPPTLLHAEVLQEPVLLFSLETREMHRPDNVTLLWCNGRKDCGESDKLCGV